jgi:hypothetical protein
MTSSEYHPHRHYVYATTPKGTMATTLYKGELHGEWIDAQRQGHFSHNQADGWWDIHVDEKNSAQGRYTKGKRVGRWFMIKDGVDHSVVY